MSEDDKIDTSDIQEAGKDFFEKAQLVHPNEDAIKYKMAQEIKRTHQQRSPYQHKEAFALMWYACPCGHQERIWNSRDGVTPFGGVSCPSCDGAVPPHRSAGGGFPGLRHVMSGLDVTAPGHKLIDGQRFFRDGRPDEAVAIIKRRIEKINAQVPPPGVPPLGPVPADVAFRLFADAADTTGEWTKGWPMVDRHCEPKIA